MERQQVAQDTDEPANVQKLTIQRKEQYIAWRALYVLLLLLLRAVIREWGGARSTGAGTMGVAAEQGSAIRRARRCIPVVPRPMNPFRKKLLPPLSLSEEHSPPAPLPWRAASLPSPHGTIGAVCPADMGSRCRSLGHALESWQRFSHPAPADGCERHRLFAGVLGRLFAKRRGNVYENTSNWGNSAQKGSIPYPGDLILDL
jgi:hypothetical protein